MAQVPVPAPPAPAAASATACRLDAYVLAVEFDRLAFGLGLKGALRNQLVRASASVALCVAEGSGRFAPRDKRHFYVMALGSARECAAVLDLARVRGLAEVAAAEVVLRRVVRAVEGLVRAMERR